jgi:hypothetical protein
LTISSDLQQAIDGLQIQDVYLRWTHSECAEGFRPQYEDFSAMHLQQMHVLKRAEVFEIEGDGKLLQVQVLLGARWVLSAPEGAEPEVKAFIEAEFIAEYRFTTEIVQVGIDEFSQKNASYHVWPYWREYLAAQTERLRLPRVVLPVMQLPHHKLQMQSELPQ